MTVYIYGAGKKGVHFLRQLKFYITHSETDVDKIFFIDEDKSKQGCSIDGVKIISLEMAILQKESKDIVVSTVPNVKNTLQDLFGIVISGIDFLEYFIPQTTNNDLLTKVHPFNHYESPYPDDDTINKLEKEYDDKDVEVHEISFRLREQAFLLKDFLQYSPPVWEEMYDSGNVFFGPDCADALYYMMRCFRPQKIVEIGSGFSTAAMLDVNKIFFDNSIDILCIEPLPDRLLKIVGNKELINLRVAKIQDVPLDIFSDLKANDFLFIDSSHVAKHGSDVTYEIFEILPCLAPGVHIHFHDITYPFQYPISWIKEGRAYNEMYLIRAFLMNNIRYDIELFNGGGVLFDKHNISYPEQFRTLGNGSLWIKKK